MTRISGVRRLRCTHLALFQPAHPPSAPFIVSRCISTTAPSRSKNTEWVRGKLWKGEAPGAEDPYTQRSEEQTTSNLPQEAIEKRDRTPLALRQSKLALPPRRSEALTEQEARNADPTYVEATEIDELEELPSLSNWWDQPGHWGAESEFKAFGAPDKVIDKAVLEVYLRRAVVETLALQEAGAFPEWATKKWNDGGRDALDAALAVGVEVSNGTASVNGASHLAEQLTAEAADEVQAGDRLTVEEAGEISKAWDPSWKSVHLDTEVKFALRKRLYQLTGNLVPDAKLAAASTVDHVLTLAAAPPKDRKLHEVLQESGKLPSLPNVTMHSRRVTPIDKEKQVGRWKVIEEELTKRGLPVTGTGGTSGNTERRWLSERD